MPFEELMRRWLLARADTDLVDAPLFPDRTDGPTFPLAYADAGREKAGPALVVLPGGPGLASVVPYRRVRRRLVDAGFRVLMPEHRGVGLSRLGHDGEPLPVEAMRLSFAAHDVLAVLDRAGVERAILLGTSYGGYLALAAALAAPERWRGLMLDSTAPSAHLHEREHQRALFWRGEAPDTAQIATLVRDLAGRGLATDEELSAVTPWFYEFLGPGPTLALLRRVAAGHRRLWRRLARLGEEESAGGRRAFVFDAEPAMAIWLREVERLEPDGEPFDRTRLFAPLHARYRDLPFEPVDLAGSLADLALPTVVLHGGRDARIPPVAVQELVERLPDAVLVGFPAAGHDLLRLRTAAVTAIAAGLARGGLSEAVRVGEPVRHVRPRVERWAARGMHAGLAFLTRQGGSPAVAVRYAGSRRRRTPSNGGAGGLCHP